MKLIKLGAAYLNMDLVTDVWVNRGSITVFFAVPTMYSAAPFHGVTTGVTTREVSFHGAQATALIRWLEKRAKDITPDGEEVETIDVNSEGNAGSTDGVAGTDYDAVDDGPGS